MDVVLNTNILLTVFQYRNQKEKDYDSQQDSDLKIAQNTKDIFKYQLSPVKGPRPPLTCALLSVMWSDSDPGDNQNLWRLLSQIIVNSGPPGGGAHFIRVDRYF